MFRFWINGSVFLGLCILVGYMIRQETLDALVVEQTVEYSDRLVKMGILYEKEERESNFINFGMDTEMISSAQKVLKKWDKKKSKIKKLLQDAYNDEELHEKLELAFCARTEKQRPRYLAAIFLLKKDKDSRIVLVDLKKMTNLEFQDWTEVIEFEEVYRKLEFRAHPKIDSTMMFASALFAKKTSAIMREEAPWGEGDNWSWKDVKKQYHNLSIELNAARYLALMHLFTEIAQDSENSICVSE